MAKRLKLVTPRHVRLHDTSPVFVGYEQQRHRRYPYSVLIDTPVGEVQAKWRVPARWRRIADYDYVRERELFCWLILGRERVGAIQITGIDVSFDATNRDFFQSMDDESIALMDLAHVLCGGWEDVSMELTAYGPIVELSGVWVRHAYARHGWWADIAKNLIEATFPMFSVLVMKAFPLEYEGIAAKRSRREKALMRRQAAMIRYYGHIFGTSRFPSESGKEGWLWAVSPRVADIIDPPGTHDVEY